MYAPSGMADPPRAVREVQVRPRVGRQKTVCERQLVHSKARIREMDRLAKVDLEVAIGTTRPHATVHKDYRRHI